MRALCFVLLNIVVLGNLYGIRAIDEKGNGIVYKAVKLIPIDERAYLIDRLYTPPNSNSTDEKKQIIDNEVFDRYSDVLTSLQHMSLYFQAINLCSKSNFRQDRIYVELCRAIPYVRESQTGLAVEALIKRLENALHGQEKPKTKNRFRKEKSATKPFDFSILDAFQPDDLENVALMNREWRDHHEDPEYDHGAAKYWFADLDGDLERALKNAKSKLVYIGQMYNHSMQQHRAWQILYDWREYFSGSYAGK